jgi:hypothetical protein
MHKHLLPITLLAGSSLALLAGCGDRSAQYTFGERVRLKVESVTDGESLLELSVGPTPGDRATARCTTTKVDVALKGFSVAALVLTHRHNECRV